MAGSRHTSPHQHVLASVPMRLAAEPADVAVTAELHFSTRDAFAVRATFHRRGFAPVVWTFARDLLLVGVARHAGIGDVQIHPNGAEVVIDLASPQGTASLVASGVELTRFNTRMLSVVPVGDEPGYLDMDSEIAGIIGTISAGGSK